MYQVTTQSAVTGSSNNTSSSTILSYPYGENSIKYPLVNKNIKMDVLATGGTPNDGTVVLQESYDDSNWSDVAGSVITVSATGKQTPVLLTGCGSKYYRTVYTKNSGTGGTITTTLTFS